MLGRVLRESEASSRTGSRAVPPTAQLGEGSEPPPPIGLGPAPSASSQNLAPDHRPDSFFELRFGYTLPVSGCRAAPRRPPGRLLERARPADLRFSEPRLRSTGAWRPPHSDNRRVALDRLLRFPSNAVPPLRVESGHLLRPPTSRSSTREAPDPPGVPTLSALPWSCLQAQPCDGQMSADSVVPSNTSPSCANMSSGKGDASDDAREQYLQKLHAALAWPLD